MPELMWVKIRHTSVYASLLEYLSRPARVAPELSADGLLAVVILVGSWSRQGRREDRVFWSETPAFKMFVPLHEIPLWRIPSYREERRQYPFRVLGQHAITGVLVYQLLLLVEALHSERHDGRDATAGD